MASKYVAAQIQQLVPRASFLCWGATSILQPAFFTPSPCSLSVRYCSTGQGHKPESSAHEAGPPSSSPTPKKHSVLIKGGPRTMIREDILDIFARHNLQVPPESITPFYHRRPGEGIGQFGWAVQLLSHTEGPHRVTVEEYSFRETHLKYLQHALQSAGRFLLVQNLPPEATRKDVLQMVRGFRLLEGEDAGPCDTH